MVTTKFKITYVGHVCGLHSVSTGQHWSRYFKRKEGEMCMWFFTVCISQNTIPCSLFAGGVGCLPTVTRTYDIIDFCSIPWLFAVYLVFGLFVIFLATESLYTIFVISIGEMVLSLCSVLPKLPSKCDHVAHTRGLCLFCYFLCNLGIFVFLLLSFPIW